MDAEQIEKLYRSGSGLIHLEKLTGMNHAKVREILVDRGVPIRAATGQFQPWPISVEEAHQRYLAGESAATIGNDIEVSAITVLARFRSAGLSVRDRSEGARARYAKNADVAEEACRLYQSGLSMAEVAERLGMSASYVWKALKRAGLPRRPKTCGGAKHGSWAGGYTYDKHGYILVRRPEHPDANNVGYVRAHRLVMESQIGRPLAEGEVVDHKDGDTSNNHPENLRLFASNGDHLKATRVGRPRLTQIRREVQRLEAVQRACRRLVSTLEALENDARWSHVAWPPPSTAPRKAPRTP